MLVSFIVFIDSPDYKGQIKSLLKRLKCVDHPITQMEVLVCARPAAPSQVYKVDGPPLIRIIPTDLNKATAINKLLNECHGHKVIVIDERIKFRPDMIKRIQKTDWEHRAFVGKGYFTVDRWFEYPFDSHCLKTIAIIDAMLMKKKITGRMGRLNKTEILRMVYRWGEFTFKNKIRLIWGWIWGI